MSSSETMFKLNYWPPRPPDRTRLCISMKISSHLPEPRSLDERNWGKSQEKVDVEKRLEGRGRGIRGNFISLI